MAWNTGNMTAAAGELKALLDTYLPANGYWHIEDAGAGANIGVYHCYDAARNIDFVLKVADDQADYSTIELWEGWDSGAHAGTGQSLTAAHTGGYTLRIFKSAAGFVVRVKDHNLVFIDTNLGTVYYAGGLGNRFDGTKNIVIFIGGCSCGASNTRNPCGARTYITAGSATHAVWRALFDESGNVRTVLPQGVDYSTTESSNTSNTTANMTKTIGGTIRLEETGVVNFTSRLLLGELDGICWTFNLEDGVTMVSGETVELNGVIWQMFKGGGFGCVVEQS